MELEGNGLPLSVPEDDKTWSMIESSYQQLEFTFAATPQQASVRPRKIRVHHGRRAHLVMHPQVRGRCRPPTRASVQVAQKEAQSIRHIQESWRYTIAVRKARMQAEEAELRAQQRESEAKMAVQQMLLRQASLRASRNVESGASSPSGRGL